jgi:hypothetical protein
LMLLSLIAYSEHERSRISMLGFSEEIVFMYYNTRSAAPYMSRRCFLLQSRNYKQGYWVWLCPTIKAYVYQ